MIIKSSQRAGHKDLAAHLSKLRDEDGSSQTVTIIGSRNLLGVSTLEAALNDMEIMSWASSKTRKDLYHVSMSPSDELTPAQWEEAWNRYDEEFRLGDYPYVEVQHEKRGRCHRHRVYERVDTETQRAIRLSFTKIRNEKVCRELEYVFGHPLVVGAHNKAIMTQLTKQGKDNVVAWMEQGQAHTVARPIAAEQFGEIQQDRRSGGRCRDSGQRRRGPDGAMTKAVVKNILRDAYAKTDNGSDFAAVIAQHGLTLVREYRDRSGRGNMETFVVIDAGGERHSPRRMLGVKVAELRRQWLDHKGATPAVLDQLQQVGGQASDVGRPDIEQTEAAPQYIDYGAIDKADQEQRRLPPPAVPSVPTKQQLRVLLMEAYAASDSGKAFEAAMASYNLLLCRRDRRQALYVVDAEGNAYNTTRLIGVKTAETRQRWADLDPASLMTTVQAQQLRELQWARLLAEQQVREVEDLHQEMTSADRLLEQQLVEDIAALQTDLYRELAGEGPGAALYASTSPIALVNSGITAEDSANTDDTASDSTAAAWAEQFSGLGMNPETMVLLYGDGEEEASDQFDDGSTYGYANLKDWQEQTQEGTDIPPALAPSEQDARSLITQQSHWQTIAGAGDAPERRPPQGNASGGIGKEPTTATTSTDSHPDNATTTVDQSSRSQQFGDDAELFSWGLNDNTVLLIRTYAGQLADGERDKRIEAALAAASPPTKRQERSQPGSLVSSERPQQHSAARTYLQALGRHLQQRGRTAYSQSDRWLAEILARRGYSRRETRRVIAHSSPALMAQFPGKRVGYIRRLTDRVYRRQEYWRPQVAPAAERKNAYGQTTQRRSKGADAAPGHQQGTPRRTPPPNQVRKPKWWQQDHGRDGRET